MALDIRGRFDASDLEESGSEIDVERHRGLGGSGLDDAGPADEQRHLEGFFVHEPFVVPAVVSEEEPLVTGIDIQQGVREPRSFNLVLNKLGSQI